MTQIFDRLIIGLDVALHSPSGWSVWGAVAPKGAAGTVVLAGSGTVQIEERDALRTCLQQYQGKSVGAYMELPQRGRGDRVSWALSRAEGMAMRDVQLAYDEELECVQLVPPHVWRQQVYGPAYGRLAKQKGALKRAAVERVKYAWSKEVTHDEAEAILIGYSGLQKEGYVL